MDHNDILELKEITKLFPGTLALDKVGLSIRRGEVHALVGENGAGKSTLMKIVSGIYKPTSGEIWYDGNCYRSLTPAKALSLGISMIPQELNPILNMTIAENIFLHRESIHMKVFTDREKQEERASVILKKIGLDYKASTKMKDLSIAQMQMVEIAKAISFDAKVVIMDEPTSSLDAGETEHLFEIIKDLKRNGVSVIYISHRLEEIDRICDRLTVFRDGHSVGLRNVADVTRNEIIELMVGHSVRKLEGFCNAQFGKEVLSVQGLGRKGYFHDISFSVHEGEVVGFSGLVGAGRSEVMKSIFGIDPLDQGKIVWYGQEITIKSPRDAINKGIAMVTEDRRKYGLVLCRSILENTSLPSLQEKHPGLFINLEKEKKEVGEQSKRLSIKAPSVNTASQSLSGGNQQKVIIAKWLMASPKLLILDEPTRGIDVGAKDEIYQLIEQFVKQGMAIILISSEMSEVMGLSNRLFVMHEGKLMGQFSHEDIVDGTVTQEDILNRAFGGR